MTLTARKSRDRTVHSSNFMTSSNPQDREADDFGTLAVLMGFLTAEQKSKVLQAQAEARKAGAPKRFGEVCLERKLLTREQVAVVLRAQGKRVLNCPACRKSYNVHGYTISESYRCRECGGDLAVPDRPPAPKVSDSVLLTQTDLRSTNVRVKPLPISSEFTDLFPDLEILRQVGQGGMGTVFKAREKAGGRLVALKVLAPFLAGNDSYVKRFLREAKNLKLLHHPNIVGSYGAGEAGEYKYLLMEYVDGVPLSQVLKKKGKLDEKLSLTIVRDVALGLDYAWQHRIIHRDVKPHNIMLGRDHSVKLCDLGLSKELGGDVSVSSVTSVQCTPAYASPEQMQALDDIDCRTDTYSLGVTLYQMVTGELPFQGKKLADYLIRILQREPADPLTKNPSLSPQTGKLILRMMEKLRENRPEPGEVARALTKWLAKGS
jgi:hypothetical protein